MNDCYREQNENGIKSAIVNDNEKLDFYYGIIDQGKSFGKEKEENGINRNRKKEVNTL